MEKTLNQLKRGEQGLVKSILATGPVKRRFMDMGITSGAKIQMDKVAPFGDPIAIKVRGYSLSLRREEAKKIILV